MNNLPDINIIKKMLDKVNEKFLSAELNYKNNFYDIVGKINFEISNAHVRQYVLLFDFKMPCTRKKYTFSNGV